MGFTQRRIIALAWGSTGYIILLSLSALLIRQTLKKKQKTEQPPAGDVPKIAPED